MHFLISLFFLPFKKYWKISLSLSNKILYSGGQEKALRTTNQLRQRTQKTKWQGYKVKKTENREWEKGNDDWRNQFPHSAQDVAPPGLLAQLEEVPRYLPRSPNSAQSLYSYTPHCCPLLHPSISIYCVRLLSTHGEKMNAKNCRAQTEKK